MTSLMLDNNLPQTMADEFSRLIRDRLTPSEMTDVLNRNRSLVAGACATRDHCDANQAMAEAFALVKGRDCNTDSDADTALWNAAWAIAKNAEFPRRLTLTTNAEGNVVYAYTITHTVIVDPTKSDCGRFKTDPCSHYELRPEEVAALQHANSFLIAERDALRNGNDSQLDPERSSPLGASQEDTRYSPDDSSAKPVEAVLASALSEYMERQEQACDPNGLPVYEQAKAALAHYKVHLQLAGRARELRAAGKDSADLLIETVNATGGLVSTRPFVYAPNADREWSDLADPYLVACVEKNVDPVITLDAVTCEGE